MSSRTSTGTPPGESATDTANTEATKSSAARVSTVECQLKPRAKADEGAQPADFTCKASTSSWILVREPCWRESRNLVMESYSLPHCNWHPVWRNQRERDRENR